MDETIILLKIIRRWMSYEVHVIIGGQHSGYLNTNGYLTQTRADVKMSRRTAMAACKMHANKNSQREFKIVEPIHGT